jgi:hypothetical protein
MSTYIYIYIYIYQGCAGIDFKFRNSEYSEEIKKSEYGIRNVQNPEIFGIGIS